MNDEDVTCNLQSEIGLGQHNAHARYTGRVHLPDTALALEAELESVATIDRLKILSRAVLLVVGHAFEQDHRGAGCDAEEGTFVVIGDGGFQRLAGALEPQPTVP